MTIGIFDSGVGGLSMVRAVDQLAPDADIIYFGDTARIPYGTKTTEQLEKICSDNFSVMNSLGADRLFVACGTMSSLLYNKGYPDMGIPYTTVIEATAAKAASSTRSGSVAVLGTEATVRNRGFEKELFSFDPGLRIRYFPCQDFVMLCESGRMSPDDPEVRLAVDRYLSDMPEDTDTAILGCTHFPFLADAIRNKLGEISLINCSYEAVLANIGLFSPGSGRRDFFVSGDPAPFNEIKNRLLGYESDTLHMDVQAV